MRKNQFVSIALAATSIFVSAGAFADVQIQPNQSVTITCGNGTYVPPVDQGWSCSALCTLAYANGGFLPKVISASGKTAGEALTQIERDCGLLMNHNPRKLVTVDDANKLASIFNSCLKN